MPIMLQPRDFISEVEGFDSVLVVSCSMCPPMSMAMQTETPFIELFKHGVKTPVFEKYIQSVCDQMKEHGIRTDVFTSRLPTPLMCVWTEGQRQRLLDHAKGFDAVLVLGCSSAVKTAEDALRDIDCPVFLGMRMKGIANGKIVIKPPMNIHIRKVVPPEKSDFKPCEQPCEADIDATNEAKHVANQSRTS